MKAKNKKEPIPMDRLTAGYEKFIKGKEINNNGRIAFDKAIKKASKPRSAK